MKARRKICVITGSRAEYGLLYWLLREIQDDADLELQLVATGMHLSPEFGLTYKIIEQDGFRIAAKVEMLLSSDTPVGIAKSIGVGVMGFADALERLAPDLLVVLGDRFEILAAAQAALVAKIPVAHVAGGDTTEGAFDEAMRHSITKMSHLHFVTNAEAGRRVRQLGENPAHIFNVGSPGLDFIKRLQLLDREEVQTALNFRFRSKNLLITFHPATLERIPAAAQFQALLDALDRLGSDFGLIFTKPNADNEGRALIRLLEEFAAARDQAAAYTSLGQKLYLSTLAQVDAMVGNSSSGLYEAPSFKKPTVNIGDRQKGRLQAASVLNCPPVPDAIHQTILAALTLDCSEVVNPYGDGEASGRMVTIIKNIDDFQMILQKKFFDISGSNSRK
jgi:UDP-N-acetylglucosamine 2-epimerase (non-hydrolysing)/GDP/UDP-N,N'-diacetylbacillosamine 2-epimerase (hydrolysing)